MFVVCFLAPLTGSTASLPICVYRYNPTKQPSISIASRSHMRLFDHFAGWQATGTQQKAATVIKIADLSQQFWLFLQSQYSGLFRFNFFFLPTSCACNYFLLWVFFSDLFLEVFVLFCLFVFCSGFISPKCLRVIKRLNCQIWYIPDPIPESLSPSVLLQRDIYVDIGPDCRGLDCLLVFESPRQWLPVDVCCLFLVPVSVLL